MSFLSIDKIETSTQYTHPEVWHSVLPQHEFGMLIVAPKGSGKTNFICNLILKQYKAYFHKILVCSPTVYNDEKWDVVKKTKHVLRENVKLKKILGDGVPQRKLHKLVNKSMTDEKQAKEKFTGLIPEECFFDDMDLIPGKMAEQQQIVEDLKNKHGQGEKAKYLSDRILLIMDDQAGLYVDSKRNPIINYFLKHRHFSSSVIVVTQSFTAIPKTIRTNCEALILFECPSSKEQVSVYEEFPANLKFKEWLQVYEYCTKKPYSFMYVNTKFLPGQRMYCQFSQKIQVTGGDDNIDTEQ